MAKVVVKLALITFFLRLAWLCKSSPAESCAVGDAECTAESPRKSGDAMLQFRHKVNEESSNEAREAGEVAGRTGKGRQGEEKVGKGRKEDVGTEEGDLFLYYYYFGIKPQPKFKTYSASGEPGWANMVKKDLVDPKQDWVWELDGYGLDEIWYSNHDGKDWTAYVSYPTCSAPDDGFPALIIMPGRSLKKIRHKYWVAMFASQGVVAMSPDVGKFGTSIRDSRIFLETTEDYPVNTNDIHLLGYSAGAGAVLTNSLNAGNTKRYNSFTVVAGINPYQVKDHYAEPNPILLIQAQNDGMYGAAGKWPIVSGWAEDQIALDGGQTKFLAYKDGGHQPMQQTSFFSEVLKFIKAPAEYTIPNDAGRGFSSGSFAHSPVTAISETLGCLTNDEGITPIFTLNLWQGNTGQACCLAACKQVKGCVAFDYLKKKTPDGMNCILFSEVCSAPKHPDGMHYTWAGYDGPATSPVCNTE